VGFPVGQGIEVEEDDGLVIWLVDGAYETRGVPKVMARYVDGLDTADSIGLGNGEFVDAGGYSSGNYRAVRCILMWKMKV
jgi:hypothetical protein